MTKALKQNIELNPAVTQALELMNGSDPFVFITGRAGTGKSTLLRYFRASTLQQCAYLAPTGVAALNIAGETVHTFFRFTPGITTEQAKKKGARADRKLYSSFDAIVIDEISMVRADLLDCVDAFLQAVTRVRKPFGGKRIICIGDLYQLPPVVTSSEAAAFRSHYETPYFFSAQVVQQLIAEQQVTFIELEKVYRQQDPTFIALLNGVRNRSITPEQLTTLNERIVDNPITATDDDIHLTTTNAASDEVNQRRLAALSGAAHHFTGERTGTFPEKDMPTDRDLELKKGARVMLLNNDSIGRWVNGSLGVIEKLDAGSVSVRLDGTTQDVRVEPYTWTLYRSVYNSAQRQLDQERLGSFTQLPLRLAWATTIHKSQGKTFDRCVIDLGRGAFVAGQVYVALSRCRSFEGIRLIKPVTTRQLLLDWRVMKFLTSLQYRIARAAQSSEDVSAMLQTAIDAQQTLRITYLKGKDEKSCREIQPRRMGPAEYNGHPYMALEAYCLLRKDTRIFNVGRILSAERV